MDNEEELVRRVVAVAIQEVAPKILIDPLKEPNRFVYEALRAMQAELAKRLAPLGPLATIFPGLTVSSVSYQEFTELQTLVATESGRLKEVSENERRIALVGFLTRELIRRRFEEVRAAVTALTKAQDEGIKSAKLATDTLQPAPVGPDPLVKALASYQAGGIRLLRGFLGESELPNYRRLYSSLELNDYLDIPRDAILQAVDLRTTTNPLGGAAVWVRVGAEVYRGRRGIAKAEIQGQFLSGAAGGWGGRGEEWTSVGRGEEWTSVGRGEEWTSVGRGEEWTSVGR